jgi:hypothetical protein
VGTKPPSRRRSTKGETPDGTAPAAGPGVPSPIANLVVVSDLHVGCQLGLCHPDGARLDGGGVYHPSILQRKVWDWWEEFWQSFVPSATKGEPYAVVINGDILDGVHHNSTTQWSHNLTDQAIMARSILAPVVSGCGGRFYVVRGTESHVGQSAQEEERLSRELGAIANVQGQFARYELWKMVGDRLVHCLHHIGTTGSQAYEATAVHKELIESITEAGRWNRRFPDCVVRSHRHRYIEDVIPTANGKAVACVTPAWQLKTGYVFRVAGGRLSEPQIGGLVIRVAHGELFVRPWVQSLEREAPE